MPIIFLEGSTEIKEFFLQMEKPLIHEKKYLNKLRCYSDIKILSVNNLPPTLTLDVIYFDWKSKLIDIKIHTRQELLKRYYST